MHGNPICAARNFNSHAHVERDIKETKSKLDVLNFNSHAHVERDSCAESEKGYHAISTHTLTWSVTDVY